MRIVKIGSSSNCDIVLHSTYVSSIHAEITVLDSGEIFIEDKKSTNGTFVGNKRLQPGVETRISRGDYIRFADVELQWGQVPTPENNSQYKSVINIGSNFRNDITLSSPIVSRFHATVKIDKKNRVYIVDNHSKNGVLVNGKKITPGRLVQITSKDTVLCGNEDITMQLKSYFKSGSLAWLGWTAGAFAAVAAIIVAVILLWPGPDPYDKYKNAVVYVHASYRFKVYVEGFENLDPFVWPSKEEDPRVYSGTAFFIDREGRLCTNKHIAKPWVFSDADSQISAELKNFYELYRQEQLPVDRVETDADLEKLKRTSWGNALVTAVMESDADDKLVQLNLLLNKLKRAEVVISGEHEFMGIGYSSEYYSNNQYDECHLLCEASDENVDVALIRLDSNETPKKVTNIIDINSCVMERPAVNQEMHVLGYPGGRHRTMDEIEKSLELQYKVTSCCKEPNRYYFWLDYGTIGGASGSPVLNEKGQLCGVLYGGYRGDGAVTAVNHAKFIKELYDKEVK